MPGCFIAFEGVDGSGKSTQAKLCAHKLAAQGYEVVTVREPGGTALSDAIRELVLDPSREVSPSAELLLYMAARAQLVAQVIAPALAQGKLVLSDRFGWSTFAYQGYGRGISRKTIEDLMRAACGEIWPHLMVVLDIDPQLRRSRLLGQGRPLDRLEREDEGFFSRVRQGFLDLATQAPSSSVVFAGGAPAEELNQAIMSKILSVLPSGLASRLPTDGEKSPPLCP